MKNVFTRLTAKTLKANRTRTMVTIIGILLATAMLTAVTTFISSLQHYMLENVIAENGDWHGEAMQIPEKKVEELAGMKEVTMQVTWQELGYALDGVKPSYIASCGYRKNRAGNLYLHSLIGLNHQNLRLVRAVQVTQ